ncbi:hypothetical protein [Streptomyces sp. NPDC058045]|uniref:hypothetical protein n=1 Tax=Streptomyces sp. NPDC058045 TaxID=3346311 RepID=UPI0036E3862F
MRVGPLLTAAATARTGLAALRRTAPGGRERWQRTNHRGHPVDLYAGPATAAALTAAALPVRGAGPAAALAVLGAAACRAYDDVAGADDPRRGFAAHLGALAEGEVTSGVVKLFGVTAAALAAGVLLKRRPVDRLLAGVVIAGAAHFVNLVDVRPGRATAAALALGAPGVLRPGPGGELAAAVVGAAAAVLPDDAAARTMLGDTGAHALGAALGTAVVAGNGRTGLLLHAAVFTAAAVCGGRVSALAGGGVEAVAAGLRGACGSAHSCE